MDEMRARMMDVLNKYYGESRSIEHKEEIIDFLEMNGDLVLEILKAELED